MATELQIRRALREEVSWRQGIRWFLGWGNRDERYWTRGKIQFVEEAPDGDILVTAQNGWIMKISRSYEVRWRRLEGVMGSDWGNAATWNHHTNKVLVSDPANKRVLVYDPEADRIELTLTEWGPDKPFGRVRAEWEGHYLPSPGDVEAEGRILVADLDNHVVGVFEPDGTLLYTFGEYGVPGSGKRLNEPNWASGHRNYCWIADRRNHRVIVVDLETGKIHGGACYPYPTYVNPAAPDWYTVTSEYFRPIVWSADGMIGMPWWVCESCLTMTKEGTFLGTNHGNVIEWDLRAAPLYAVPAIFPNITAASLDANASSGIFPLICLGWRKVQVQAYSTQDATLNVYSLRTRGGDSESPVEAALDSEGNLQWQLYDSIPLPAGELKCYVLEGGVGVFGVEVVMGSSAGEFDLRGLFQP